MNNFIQIPRIGNPKVDFGPGFYVTSNPFQAYHWAVRKRKTHNHFEWLKKKVNHHYRPQLVKGAVLLFEVDVDALLALQGLVFKEPCQDWGTFVYNNRTKCYPSNHQHNLDARYHFVYGPLADGNILALVKTLDDRPQEFESFLQSIQPTFLRDDQLSFHTEAAIKCLRLHKEVLSLEEAIASTSV